MLGMSFMDIPGRVSSDYDDQVLMTHESEEVAEGDEELVHPHVIEGQDEDSSSDEAPREDAGFQALSDGEDPSASGHLGIGTRTGAMMGGVKILRDADPSVILQHANRMTHHYGHLSNVRPVPGHHYGHLETRMWKVTEGGVRACAIKQWHVVALVW